MRQNGTGVKIYSLQFYEALTEKGYNPVNQIVGLLCRETLHISKVNNARALL